MQKINFQDLPSTTTPISASNLNTMQTNVEGAFKSTRGTSAADTYNQQFLNDRIVNIGSTNDSDYKVNFIKSKNLIDEKTMTIGTFTYDNSGNRFVTNNYIGIEFIPTIPNTTYTFSATLPSQYTSIRYVQFTSSKTFISRSGDNAFSGNITFTTGNNCYYIAILCYKTTTDASANDLSNAQLELSSSATTYEAFKQNVINVNDTKYTDTINVGTEVDNYDRVNVLHSRNLFNKNDYNSITGYIGSTVSVITASGSGVKILYIPCKPNTTYIMQKVASKRFALGTTRTTPAVGVNFYDLVSGSTSTTKLTITTESQAKYLIAEYYISGSANPDTLTEQEILDSVMINEGSTALSYEPYITPSINVDGEEIYSKPVILWENPNPTSDFASGNITLNDNLNNYSYYEVIFKIDKTNDDMKSTGKTLSSKKAYLDYCTHINYRRKISSITNNIIQFDNAGYFQTYGTQNSFKQANGNIIPYQVIAYK